MEDWEEEHNQHRLAKWFTNSHASAERIQFFIGAGMHRPLHRPCYYDVKWCYRIPEC